MERDARDAPSGMDILPETDWAAVRDNLVAAGIGGMVGSGITAGRNASAKVRDRLLNVRNEILTTQEDASGKFVLIDRRSGSTIILPSSALDAEIFIYDAFEGRGNSIVEYAYDDSLGWIIKGLDD